MEKPLVSVLINNHNYGEYICECISSVLAQDYDNIEVILYDDDSNDNSLIAVEKYREQIAIICGESFHQPPAFRQANAIYRSFLASTGDIICLLDSDDIFLRNKISTIVDKFHLSSDIVMVQHEVSIVDGISNEVIGKKKHLLSKINIEKAMRFLKRPDMFFAQTSALAFRRTFLAQHLPIKIDNLDKVWSDFRLSRVAAMKGRVETIDEVLGYWRNHTRNDSHKLQDKTFFLNCYKQINKFTLGLDSQEYKIKLYWRPTVLNSYLYKIKLFIYILFSKETFEKKVDIIYGAMGKVLRSLYTSYSNSRASRFK